MSRRSIDLNEEERKPKANARTVGSAFEDFIDSANRIVRSSRIIIGMAIVMIILSALLQLQAVQREHEFERKISSLEREVTKVRTSAELARTAADAANLALQKAIEDSRTAGDSSREAIQRIN